MWWVVPTFALARVVWEGEPGRPGLKDILGPIIKKKSEVERSIVVQTGGMIAVRSAEDPDTLVSSGLDGVVLDEAARINHRAWGNLRPALSDRMGWAMFPSTPNSLEPDGRWYEDLFHASRTLPDWETWQRPTSDNPLISPQEIEAMRNESNMTALKFQQEIMAQFVSATGAVFKASDFRYFHEDDGYFVLDPAGEGSDYKRLPVDQGQRFATVDLAVSLKEMADYTVIASCHVTPENELLVLDVHRERMEGPDQLPAIRRALDRWRLGVAWIERTGYQLALIQAALRQGMPVRELHADRDKLARSQTLQAMIEGHRVYFRRRADWLNAVEPELLSFPGGAHDDICDALAYAAQVATRGGQGTQVLDFGRRDRGKIPPNIFARAS